MITILLITNKSDITTDFIVKKLREKEQPFYRLNTEEIGISVKICFNIHANKYTLVDKHLNCEINLLNIKSVYFRRPEINNHISNLTLAETNFIKSELLFCLEGLYKILNKAFWINTVNAIRNAENKIFQLQLALEIGFNVPQSIITNDPEKAFNFYNENKNHCIIKPIKSGLVEGDQEEGVIFTSEIQLERNNIVRIESSPVYLQSLIEKKGDIRVTIVRDKIFAAFIHSQDLAESQIDWRKARIPLKHSKIELPIDLANNCFILTKKLSLNFAAIDLVLDKENNYFFLEINPNGQWAWIERQLNYTISDEITNLLVENSFT